MTAVTSRVLREVMPSPIYIYIHILNQALTNRSGLRCLRTSGKIRYVPLVEEKAKERQRVLMTISKNLKGHHKEEAQTYPRPLKKITLKQTETTKRKDLDLGDLFK